MTERIALLGFRPWTDPARQIAVAENPAALAAEACARSLIGDGRLAAFVPVEVSGDGISSAMRAVETFGASVVVALGQTPGEPRVERFGRVPGAWAPAQDAESTPWLLAPDADVLALRLEALHDPASETGAFRPSDDAGAYFCDHLCVELVRDARRRGTRARFLHVTSVDGCVPAVRDARIGQYALQARVVVEWLLRGPRVA